MTDLKDCIDIIGKKVVMVTGNFIVIVGILTAVRADMVEGYIAIDEREYCIGHVRHIGVLLF